MIVLLCIAVLSLAGVVGWLWAQVCELKARVILIQMRDRETAAVTHIRCQRQDAEHRMHETAGRRRA